MWKRNLINWFDKTVKRESNRIHNWSLQYSPMTPFNHKSWTVFLSLLHTDPKPASLIQPFCLTFHENLSNTSTGFLIITKTVIKMIWSTWHAWLLNELKLFCRQPAVKNHDVMSNYCDVNWSHTWVASKNKYVIDGSWYNCQTQYIKAGSSEKNHHSLAELTRNNSQNG